MATVTVIIVSYNTRPLTLECLRHLHADLASARDAVDAEVWVVDNGSADGSATAVAAEFPGVRVVTGARNLGFAAANNLAIGRTSGEFVLLLNSDAFVRPGAVGALVRHMRARPDVALLGPRLLNQDGSLQRSCYRLPGPWRAFCEHTLLAAAFPNSRIVGDYRAWDHGSDRDVEVVIGACCLVCRSAVERVGGLDEAFFFYGEDLDWCMRFRRAGYRIAFTPSAEVVHLGGASGKAQPEWVFREFQSAVDRFHRKHYGRSGLAFFRAMQCAGAMTRLAAFGVAGAFRPAARQGIDRRREEWRRVLAWSVSRGAGPAVAGGGTR